MSHSVTVTVSPCVVCDYLSSLQLQYVQIGMNYPTYFSKIQSMLNHAVMHNLEADRVNLLAMWTSEKDDLSSLKTAAFSSWMETYRDLNVAPVIPEE